MFELLRQLHLHNFSAPLGCHPSISQRRPREMPINCCRLHLCVRAHTAHHHQHLDCSIFARRSGACQYSSATTVTFLKSHPGPQKVQLLSPCLTLWSNRTTHIKHFRTSKPSPRFFHENSRMATTVRDRHVFVVMPIRPQSDPVESLSLSSDQLEVWGKMSALVLLPVRAAPREVEIHILVCVVNSTRVFFALVVSTTSHCSRSALHSANASLPTSDCKCLTTTS